MNTIRRIAFNASMLDEKPTGVGVYTYNIINNVEKLYVDRQTHTINVYTPTETFLSDSLSLRKLPVLLQSSRYGKLAAACRFFWNTVIYPIQSRRMDLLVSPTTHGSFLRKSQILTIHDLLSLRYENISLHQRIYFKYLLPYLVKRVKKVIAVSESTKRDIVDFLGCPAEKIEVVYNGFDQSRFFYSAEITQDINTRYRVRNYLLGVGPTYAHKNFDKLIRAYGWLSDQQRTQFPLVIAGGMKPYIDQLKTLVTELGLQQHVRFLGYVPTELMRSLYREAHALVFPSIYEGFGFPLLEAMACGCPVISSHTSSMPEVCGEAAVYFDPSSCEEIATAIRSVITSPGLRQSMIQKGLERAKLFSWEKAAVQIKNIIDQNLN